MSTNVKIVNDFGYSTLFCFAVCTNEILVVCEGAVNMILE